MLNNVVIKNFKVIEDLEINPKGQTTIVIGDSGSGKTTLLKAIRSTLLQDEFPSDPITTGKKEGFIKVTHNWEGMDYTITRTFTNDRTKKSRFTVVDQNGGKHSLTDLLTKIYGKAFVNQHFDYQEYFFGNKTADTRHQYMMKAIGGDKVLENLTKVRSYKKERGKVGTSKDFYQALIDDSCINPETLDADLEFYAEPKNIDEATKVRNAKLLERVSVTNLMNQQEVVKQANDAYAKSEESEKNLIAQIADLEKKLAEAKKELVLVKDYQKKNKPDLALEAELATKIENAEIDNGKIEQEADVLYQDALMEVNEFNRKRDELNSALNNFKLYTEFETQWDELDEKITVLLEENKSIFKSRIPVPGLTIEEDGEKNIVMYNGREFTWENLGHGEAIQLSIEIQRSINPKGFNVVVIPDAQLLGSRLDDILKSCKNYNIQAIVEVTERKQPLKIVFEEEYL